MTEARKSTARTGRPKGRRDAPVNGDRVIQIVHMRDDLGLPFRDIADMLSEEYEISGQGVFAIYKRWRPWALKAVHAESQRQAREAAKRAMVREAAKRTKAREAARATKAPVKAAPKKTAKKTAKKAKK